MCIPTAVFTHPNVGTVGMTESEARSAFGAVTVYRSEFKALKHTLSGSDERTLMKLVVDDATDRVVGLHMVGADAGEIVQGFAVAMKAGATKAVFDSTIGIHPTAAEEFVTMREPVGSKAAKRHGSGGCRSAAFRRSMRMELHARLQEGKAPQIVDVRTAFEWRAGHIGGAINAPITELEARLPSLALDRSRPVVAICLSAHRSIPAVRLLRDRGFDACQLQQGMRAWWRAGLPVEKS